ncbi:flagellar biosynthetic protein FliQ [Buchnera aphidicola (Thelaxes californica)]|uniref:Flagellar biosynthetic protein FliQ n=1 Tax=Buchnera aphidicola (Thelaxes californica) TaxID=1315998 RepID=A0A4D6YEZ1_9GAMM|nr:flagellar biosynthesis protein FliQ [Buchnera aphidicola]QCI26623.1 flagellar biosynthetic protein FliQ [Buchnera aphidicola (Thelaxes californica)]
MTEYTVMNMFHEATKVALLLSAPLLITALISGLIISFIQAITQINEQSLSFIPKMISVLLVLTLLGSWMINIITNYIHDLFINIPFFIV